MAEEDPIDGLLVGDLARWAKGKTLADFEVRLDGVVPLFPGTIDRINFPKKAIFEQKVYYRVPPIHELAAARIGALERLAKIAKLPKGERLSYDEASRLFGAAMVQDFENVDVCAMALRDFENPERQYMLPEFLAESHPIAALWQVMDKLAQLRAMLDMRLDESHVKDDSVFWSITAAIAKKGNLSPLVAIDGRGQDSYLLSMAHRLIAFRTTQSSPPSSANST